jgi:hypothetical protein
MLQCGKTASALHPLLPPGAQQLPPDGRCNNGKRLAPRPFLGFNLNKVG